MKIFFEKIRGVFVPVHPTDEENFKKIKEGDIYEREFKKLRNPGNHRRLFALLNYVFDFQDQFDDFELFRKRVKWHAGFYVEYMIDDKMITELRSMSYKNLDEYDFRKLFSKILDVCLKHFCTGNHEELKKQADIIINFC